MMSSVHSVAAEPVAGDGGSNRATDAFPQGTGISRRIWDLLLVDNRDSGLKLPWEIGPLDSLGPSTHLRLPWVGRYEAMGLAALEPESPYGAVPGRDSHLQRGACFLPGSSRMMTLCGPRHCDVSGTWSCSCPRTARWADR